MEKLRESWIGDENQIQSEVKSPAKHEANCACFTCLQNKNPENESEFQLPRRSMEESASEEKYRKEEHVFMPNPNRNPSRKHSKKSQSLNTDVG